MTPGKLTTLVLSVLVISGCSLFQAPHPGAGSSAYQRAPEPGQAFLLCVIDNSLPNHKTAMWQVGAVDDRGRTTDIWFQRENYDEGARPNLILLGEPYVYRGFCPGVEDPDFRGLVDHYQQYQHSEKKYKGHYRYDGKTQPSSPHQQESETSGDTD